MDLLLNKESVEFYLKELDLKDSSRKIFGSKLHDYKLQPPLNEKIISTFEVQNEITFPLDYKFFISEIGNGGAGPKYGLFPFQMHHSGHDLVVWKENYSIGDLTKPFLHKDSWNLPTEFWEKEPNPSPDTSPEDEDEMNEVWEKELIENYWRLDLINGTIPICDLGCASENLLVVNGQQKSFVWVDERADYKGLSPLKNKNGEPVTFSDWYLSWLRRSLKLVGII
jgi:hypothetical protein